MSVDIAITSAWTQRPQDDRLRVVVAAQLRQVPVGDDPELGGEVLDQHRHQVRGEHDPEQQVAELRAALDVGGEVAGVDVGDRGDERRAEHRQRRPQPALARAAARGRSPPARTRPGSAGLGRAAAVRSAAEAAGGGESPPALRFTRIARASTAPSTCTWSPERTYSGPSNGCRSITSSAAPGAMPALGRGSGASPGRRPRHARTCPSRPARARTGCGLAPPDRQLAGRDRVAVRVERRVAELGGDQLLELLGEDVLEHLRLRVHLRPSSSRGSRRGTARAGGDGGSPPAPPAGPARSSARRGSARARPGRAPPASAPCPTPPPASPRACAASAFVDAAVIGRLERVDRLQVVLDRRGEAGLAGFSSKLAHNGI